MADGLEKKEMVSSLEAIHIKHSALSHKHRKALMKKQRRKLKRQNLAKHRDEELKKEEELRQMSPNYIAQKEQEEYEEQAERLMIENESRRQHELWLWSEEAFAEKLKKKKEQEERERQNQIETERRIKEEWEERQRKEKEEEEEKRKKKEKQEELLKKARQGENKDGDWHNPLAPVQYGKERHIETCPFFSKVGACRFGDRCSRGHPYPDSGRTILFSTMFKHFQLEQGLCEEYDTDIVLEYEDNEVYLKFKEFYEDTLPEFKAVGQVSQFKVCCNYQPHLRGNVYISYIREDDAMKAYAQFNARWYGGKQLTAQFVDIPSWRKAICGLFGKGRCPKGKECNFLHVFKNPSSEFNMADRDMESFSSKRRDNHQSDRYVHQSRSQDRRRHSRSPLRSSRRHKQSRSKSREKIYKKRSRRSRSRSRYSRSRSRSRERHHRHTSHRSKRTSRSKSRYSKSRSRSKERESRYYGGNRKKDKNYKSSAVKRNVENNSLTNSVRIDNIEHYENSLSDEVSIEKTVDKVQMVEKDVKKKEWDFVKKSRSSSAELSDGSRSSSEESYKQKHRKKKHKTCKN